MPKPFWKRRAWHLLALALILLLLLALPTLLAHAAPATPAELGERYRALVDRRLEVPPAEIPVYARLAEAAFARAGLTPMGAQYLLLVDRDPQVQSLLLLWRDAAGGYALVGASPVSTGRPGSFDHFETPLGVFDHVPDNPDFRAEGTFNDNGIRGYGLAGMRVFDFGWQQVPKGWGDGKVIQMRLQLHATDPDALEQRLGSTQSKGCIRIPGSLNRVLDRYGVIDAEYERLALLGQAPRVLGEEREPVPGAGRYLVVVDSERSERPAWSPAPSLPRVRPAVKPPAPLPPPPAPAKQPAFPIRR